MKETMQAAVYHGPNDIRIEEVPVPQIDQDEILVKVLNVNICGTDLRILHGHHRKYPEGTVRIPGHEMAGKVVIVGEKLRKYQIGDHVFVAPRNPAEYYFRTGNQLGTNIPLSIRSAR